MTDILTVLDRRQPMFSHDLRDSRAELLRRVREGSFLVLGGAGSIGQAVVKRLFSLDPIRLHVVDISENNLVELVRDIRSSQGYIEGDFQTMPLDCGDLEFAAFMDAAPRFDYVLNLSALKHVRSEKDPFTLMRMLRANVLNTEKTLAQAVDRGARRYFAVSSDKAANPANAMGATKRIMELCLVRASRRIEISSARFANVAFSDGSLLHGFGRRLLKRQPISAPEDTRRFFITADEAADLCLMSCLLGENREAFFPKPRRDFQPTDFRTIAERYLESRGYRAHPCASEEEARGRVEELAARGEWPCYFFSSDTTGEKEVEEFVMSGEVADLERYAEIGVIRWQELEDGSALAEFLDSLERMRAAGSWTREEILAGISSLLPEFRHQETGRFLDQRM